MSETTLTDKEIEIRINYPYKITEIVIGGIQFTSTNDHRLKFYPIKKFHPTWDNETTDYFVLKFHQLYWETEKLHNDKMTKMVEEHEYQEYLRLKSKYENHE